MRKSFYLIVGYVLCLIVMQFLLGWVVQQGFEAWYFLLPYGIPLGFALQSAQNQPLPGKELIRHMIPELAMLLVIAFLAYALGARYAPSEPLFTKGVMWIIYLTTIPLGAAFWILLSKRACQ